MIKFPQIQKQDSPVQSFLELDDISEFDLESIKNSIQQNFKPIVFGICGGQNSGKSFLSKWLREKFEKLKIKVIILKEKHFLRRNSTYINFIDSLSIDWQRFIGTLEDLIAGRECQVQLNYKEDFSERVIQSGELIIVEGRMVFSNEKLRKLIDLKIFLDTDGDVMLSRKIYKNVNRGIDLQLTIDEYLENDKKNNEKWIFPQKEYADMSLYNFQEEAISTNKFSKKHPFLEMILDVLKFRLKDTEYEARLVNDKMSMINKFFNQFDVIIY